MRRFFIAEMNPESILPQDATEVFINKPKRCQEISLLLESQGIPHWVQLNSEGKSAVFVSAPQFAEACMQIRLYSQENRNVPISPPQILGWSLEPLWILAVPLLLTGMQFQDLRHEWYHRGLQVAEKTIHGEWWRIFTAQTLHEDIGHLLSNLLSGYFILALIAARIPLSRVAWLLAFSAGLANLGVAFTVSAGFRSLGFSSFVFAALGMLGNLEWRLSPERFGVGLFARLRPLLAVFLLAVLTGLGEESDVLAHFYGFILGVMAGFIPRFQNLGLANPRFTGVDALGIVGFFAIYSTAWRVAYV